MTASSWALLCSGTAFLALAAGLPGSAVVLGAFGLLACVVAR